MVQHDADLGYGVGKIGQLAQLGEIQGVFQQEAHLRQDPRAGPVAIGGQGALYFPVHHLRAGVPTNRVADTAETVRAGGLERLKDRAHSLAQLQVGPADDRRGGAGRPVGPAGAFIGQFLHVLHFAHRAQLLGAVGAVLAPDLDEYGGADVVAAVDVGRQFRQQVPLIGRWLGPVHPKVVVGIADGQVGFQGGFLSLGQPGGVSNGHGQSSILT